jgi:hypothetical protein
VGEKSKIYCPNCGQKVLSLNQKFCHNCGNNLSDLFEKIEIKQEQYQYPIPLIKEKRQRQIIERWGTHSKFCLAYSLISVALLGIGLFLSSGLFFIWFFLQYNYFNKSITITLIILILIHGVALAFAIGAIVKSKEARRSESRNILEQIGKIIGILGFLTNIIAFIFGIIYLYINLPLLL